MNLINTGECLWNQNHSGNVSKLVRLTRIVSNIRTTTRLVTSGRSLDLVLRKRRIKEACGRVDGTKPELTTGLRCNPNATRSHFEHWSFTVLWMNLQNGGILVIASNQAIIRGEDVQLQRSSPVQDTGLEGSKQRIKLPLDIELALIASQQATVLDRIA